MSDWYLPPLVHSSEFAEPGLYELAVPGDREITKPLAVFVVKVSSVIQSLLYEQLLGVAQFR